MPSWCWPASLAMRGRLFGAEVTCVHSPRLRGTTRCSCCSCVAADEASTGHTNPTHVMGFLISPVFSQVGRMGKMV
jgi:hypothetical protein